MANYFIGGVGRVQAFINGENGLEHYFDAKSLTDSAINISISAEEIRGGEGAKLYAKYYHTSTFNLNMTDAMFDFKYLAAQVGSDIKIGNAKHFYSEKLTATDGKVTLNKTPVKILDTLKACAEANDKLIAWVKNCDGGYDTYEVKADNTIEIPNGGSGEFCVTYPINKEGRQVVVNAMYYPKEFVVFMTAKLFSGDACNPSKGSYIGEITVEIPRFQLDGNIDLGLNMSSPATFALNGSAYANDCGCGDEDGAWYAKITEVMLEEGDAYNGYNSIVVLNNDNMRVGDKIILYATKAEGGKMPKRYLGDFTATYMDSETSKNAIDGYGVIVKGATGVVTVTATSNGALKNKTTTFTIQV